MRLWVCSTCRPMNCTIEARARLTYAGGASRDLGTLAQNQSPTTA